MRTTILLAVALVAATPTAHAADDASADASPPRLHHVPPADAEPGVALTINATVSRAWSSPPELRYRHVGVTTWSVARFEQTAARGWVATIPADAVAPPGVEYYVASAAAAHFASAADPWRVAVARSATDRRVEDELRRVRGRRFRFHAAGEVVDFGARRPAPGVARTADSYYRIDLDITYRLLRFPLHALRFGYTQLRGPARRFGGCEEPCDKDAGFQPGGWFEVRLQPTPLLSVDARGMAVAVSTGFNLGARVEGRIGPEEGAHVALGGEYVGDVGGTFFFRLGWDTVPRLPMAATIELTNQPEPHRKTGVRLIYDVAYPMDNGLRLGLRGGYQARDQGIGGASAGLNVSIDF